MLHIEILSAFAICGAGAMVGAAMLRPSLTGDQAGAEAIRICRSSFAVIGVCLLQVLAQDGPLPLWSQAMMAFGAVSGVGMTSWALAALSGVRVSRTSMWLLVAAVAAITLAAMPLGTRGMNWVCAVGLAAAASTMAWMGRRVLLRPHDVHERLIGVTAMVMLVSSWLRASYLVTWNGAYEPHLMFLPPMLATPFALMYGVLPVVFTMLLLNVINARLRAGLHQRAMIDQLTGTLSRNALAESALELMDERRARGGTLAVVMIDLDHFKQVNDRFGHAAGDAVLRQAAQVLRAQLRPEALLARYGGEEFVALVPVEDFRVARRVAERLRHAIEEAHWAQVAPGIGSVTASLGVTLLEIDESLERALARADEAMYRAKHGGRNQVQAGLAAA